MPPTRLLSRPAASPAASGRTVAGCLIATLVSSTPVVNATFGLFLVPISRDLHWPRARVSMVLMVVAVLCAATYPLVGRLADRHGARRVALAGNLLFAASVAALSLTGGSLPRTLALFGLLGITSAIPSAMLFARLISGWFTRRRGLMLGLAGGVGNGIGCTLMPILTAWIIATRGWRDAYLALGLAVLCVGFPAILLLVRDPAVPSASPGAVIAGVSDPRARHLRVPVTGASDPGVDPPDGMSLADAARTAWFWQLLAVMALGAGSLTAIFTHVVALLTDRGIGLPVAAAAVSVIALVGSGWQLVLGHLLDRTASPRIMAPFFLLAIVGLPILAGATGAPALLGGAALIGLAIGTDYGAIPYLVGRYFGLRCYGAICGMIFGINVIVLGAAPFLTDLAYDRTGSYHAALVAVAACLGACAVLCRTLPRYSDDARALSPAPQVIAISRNAS